MNHNQLDFLVDVMDAVFEEEGHVLAEEDIEQYFHAPFFKRHHCPHSRLIVSRQTIVEQEDVLEGLADIQGIRWREGEHGKNTYKKLRGSFSLHMLSHAPGITFQENREPLNYEGNEFYRFRYTDTNIHCTHEHPQLRNLVAATSKNDLYYLHDNSIQHWSPQLRTTKTILGEPLRGAHARVPHKITTLAAMDDLLMVGGMDGGFSFMNLQTCKNPVLGSFSDTDYFEVNAIEMSRSRTGDPHAYVSTNDKHVRCLDLRTLEQKASYPTNWFVNYTAQSPDGHMIALVGDDKNGEIMSVNSRERIATLTGHRWHTFSAAWSPTSTMLATGGDDRSTCIFDTRMMNRPVHILGSEIQESVRSLRYSSCGRYLAMAEDSSRVHIVDTASDYTKAQVIDFVGDISGISFTPDAESLFIGVSNVHFS
ncbi:hypothetical protein BGZ83_010859 [Gryganskiella cystojenkinii]|nr:hypothetical protein BGZ83_010859 [Gryganskiella cystojenkinii]